MSFFDVTLFATAFATLTVIMDPIGTVPVFLGLTSRYAPLKQRRAAIQATSVSFGVIVTFAILGGQILHLLHISVEALQLSGGVLLFLVAMELLMGTDSSSPDTGDEGVNVALVPLGTPLLAGPGSIVAVMVAVGQAGSNAGSWVAVLVAVILAHVVILADALASAGAGRNHAAHQNFGSAPGRDCNPAHHGGDLPVHRGSECLLGDRGGWSVSPAGAGWRGSAACRFVESVLFGQEVLYGGSERRDATLSVPVRVTHSSLTTSVSGEIMKKTSSSLLAATAALGLIAGAAGAAIAAEPTPGSSPSPSSPATATPAPGNGADNNTPAPQPSQDTPSTPAPPSATPAPQPSQDTPSTPAPSSPAADQGGAGANSGPVGSTGVTTRGQISNGNGPAPVSARGGIRNTNTPAESAAPTGPTLANTGSAATLAAGVGAIALAGGVTLVVARRRH